MNTNTYHELDDFLDAPQHEYVYYKDYSVSDHKWKTAAMFIVCVAFLVATYMLLV